MKQSEGTIATADGPHLFYQMMGSGSPTVVAPNGTYLAGDFARLAEHRTCIFYDVRNRGRSETVTDASKLERGILHDVDDLDAVRAHFGLREMILLGHSYVGFTVMLCAMKYAAHVTRVVQLGPMQPNQTTQYPPHLTCADATLGDFFAKFTELQKERASYDEVAFCRKFWSLLRYIYVTNPADADKIDKWSRCDLPNERNFMGAWLKYLQPSIQRLAPTPDDLAKVTMPVLTVHGRKDRSAPYGGGREWALALPNARLLTIDNGGHAPWIEAPDLVFAAIDTFLDGAWPAAAERVVALDPAQQP